VKQFQCPKCGGNHFGTKDASVPTPIIECHDQLGIDCRWWGRWDEVADDGKQIQLTPDMWAQRLTVHWNSHIDDPDPWIRAMAKAVARGIAHGRNMELRRVIRELTTRQADGEWRFAK
jgi:hypothetical protein